MRLLDPPLRVWDSLAWSVARRGLAGTAAAALRRATEPLRTWRPTDGARALREEIPAPSHVRALQRAAATGPTFRVVARGVGDRLARSLETQMYRRWTLATSPGSAGPDDVLAILDADGALRSHALLAVAARFAEEPDLDVLYCDESVAGADGSASILRKPGWSEDLLLAVDYVGVPFFRRVALAPGSLGTGADGYDTLLRVTEGARAILHLPLALYDAPASRPRALLPPREAVELALARRTLDARLERAGPGWRVRRRIVGEPRVSVVVPTRDRVELLRACVEALEVRDGWPALEIVVIDNGSTDPAARAFLSEIASRHRVLAAPGPFNWSALNVRGARAARGEYLLFLNNDVEVLASGSIAALLEHAQRPDVAAVGAKLLYPDGRVQHAGLALGVNGPAGHLFRLAAGDDPGPLGLAALEREVSAVTGACMMVRRDVFDSLGGFDPRFAVAFNDVDFCLRATASGRKVIWTPHAVFLHREGATRGRTHVHGDDALLRRTWGARIAAGDPYWPRTIDGRGEGATLWRRS